MIQDTTGSKEIKNGDDSTETAISNPVEGVNRGFTTAFTRGGKVAQDSSGIKERSSTLMIMMSQKLLPATTLLGVREDSQLPLLEEVNSSGVFF